jgi:hypothetical protein
MEESRAEVVKQKRKGRDEKEGRKTEEEEKRY